MTIVFRNSTHDGMKFYYLCLRFDDVLESLYKFRIRESDQLQNCIRIVRDGDSPKGIDAQLPKIENDGEKEYRSKIATAHRNRSSGQESKVTKRS